MSARTRSSRGSTWRARSRSSSTRKGTLAERIRAGGAGIPAFFTKTGVGTLIAEGKELREFDGETYVMERGIVGDLAIVKAWKGDHEGNLVYRKTARNFNPMAATAGKVCVAEVEHSGRHGEIDPDHIHTPGIFVDRIIQGTRTTRSGSSSAPSASARRLSEGGPRHGLDPRRDGGTRRQGARGRLLRQSRHRHPDAGGELHPRRRSRSRSRARTACSAWARSRTRARRTPT